MPYKDPNDHNANRRIKHAVRVRQQGLETVDKLRFRCIECKRTSWKNSYKLEERHFPECSYSSTVKSLHRRNQREAA